MRKIHAIVMVILILSSICAYAASRAPAEAQHAMVSSSHYLASMVGRDILLRGGNAVDAAVAMGYALAVVHPCCGNIGGGGFMLIHQPKGNNRFINFREKAPKAIKPELFLNEHGNVQQERLYYGYLAVGVPGTVMGLNTALQRYGTLPLAEVMEPAIRLAGEGFILKYGDVDFFNRGLEYFKKEPNVSAIFLKSQQPYQVGERLKQPQLAKTLELIAKQGTPAFYQGEIAKKIVAANQQHGGILSLQDFKDYTVTEETPVTCRYRNTQVVSAPPPSSGGTALCQTLNILDGFALSEMGYHAAASVHVITEALRYAFADRNEHLGDPAFVKNPVKQLTSPQYAAKIREKIATNPRAGDSSKVNTELETLWGKNRKLKPSNKRLREEQYTTHYSVVANGMAVSVTYTLDAYFGAKVIAGDTGFFLNNELGDFAVKVGHANAFQLVQGAANLMAPGKRPLSSMTPTILLKDKKLLMVLGATGGSTIISTVLGVIQNVLDFGLDIQEAVDAPRFHMQWLPDAIFMEPRTFSKDTQERLMEMGYDLRLGSPYRSLFWGAANAIWVDQANHRYYGGADSRRQEGLAVGY